MYLRCLTERWVVLHLQGLAEAFQNDLHELVCPWLSNAQKRRVVDRMHRTYTFLGEPSGSRRLLSWWV